MVVELFRNRSRSIHEAHGCREIRKPKLPSQGIPLQPPSFHGSKSAHNSVTAHHLHHYALVGQLQFSFLFTRLARTQPSLLT